MFSGGAGKESKTAAGAGEPQEESEPERAEDAEPAGVGASFLRETAQAGAQSPAGHEADPGQAEPGATQVRSSQNTSRCFAMLSEESESALWVVGQQQRLTDCWLFSREKQEVGGQLKELKDQLEAEQYFTVIRIHTLFAFFCTFAANLRQTTVKIGAKLQQICAYLHKNRNLCLPFPSKTLYKTQIRELKGDCDQKSKQCKEMQRRLAEYKEER